MSRPSAMPSSEIEILAVQRRRRFSAAEKQRMVQETYQPGMTLSHVARAHGVSPSLLFRWRKLAGDGSLQAVAADESVVPASEYQEAQRQISRSNVAHRQSRRAWRDRRGRAAIETAEFSSSSGTLLGSDPRTGIAVCGRYCGGSAASEARRR